MSFLAASFLATDEKESAGPVELELGISIFEFLIRVFGVAVVVVVLVHHQHRVRSFLVLKMEGVINLESVSLSPVIEILRRVQNPAIFSTHVEFVSFRRGHKKTKEN